MNPGERKGGRGNDSAMCVGQEIGGLGGRVVFSRVVAQHHQQQHIFGSIYQIIASPMGKYQKNNLPTRRGNYLDNPRVFEVVGRLRRYFDPLGMEDVRTKSSLRKDDVP